MMPLGRKEGRKQEREGGREEGRKGRKRERERAKEKDFSIKRQKEVSGVNLKTYTRCN